MAPALTCVGVVGPHPVPGLRQGESFVFEGPWNFQPAKQARRPSDDTEEKTFTFWSVLKLSDH